MDFIHNFKSFGILEKLDEKLSKDARDFISHKISKLHDEGYKGDQAVAIAYSYARKAGYDVPKNESEDTCESCHLEEATAELDTMDFQMPSFQKYLKTHNIKAKVINPNGPGGGWPVVKYTGKRKDLENMIRDRFNPGNPGDPMDDDEVNSLIEDYRDKPEADIIRSKQELQTEGEEDWPEQEETPHDRESARFDQEREDYRKNAVNKYKGIITDFHAKGGSEGPSHDPYGFKEYSFSMKGKKYIIHLGLAQYIKIDGKTIEASGDDYDMPEEFVLRHVGIPLEDIEAQDPRNSPDYEEDPMGSIEDYESKDPMVEKISRKEEREIEKELNAESREKKKKERDADELEKEMSKESKKKKHIKEWHEYVSPSEVEPVENVDEAGYPRKFEIGSKAKVSDGSGLASNKIVTIVDRSKIKTDGRGVPLNVDGAYKPVDWSSEIAIQFEDGSFGTMHKSRLMSISNIGEDESIEEAANTVYTIEMENSGSFGRSPSRYYYQTGTLPELVKAYSYTLEVGASWEHERGNKKINRNPKNVKSLISNLNNAVNNSAANGYAGKTYRLLPEGEPKKGIAAQAPVSQEAPASQEAPSAPPVQEKSAEWNVNVLLKYYLDKKALEPGDFIRMKDWPRALVDDIDYKKRKISLQFKNGGPINDYSFSELEKILTKVSK
jgi:hypothetical protein